MHYFCCCCCYCSLFSFLVVFFSRCKLQPMLNVNSCYNFSLHIDSNEMNLYMRNYRANARINCCALYMQSLLYVKLTYFFWPDSYVFAFAWHFFSLFHSTSTNTLNKTFSFCIVAFHWISIQRWSVYSLPFLRCAWCCCASPFSGQPHPKRKFLKFIL